MTQVNLSNPKTRPAIFFDRDGVLNEDHNYVHKIVDFHWIEGAIEAIRCCNELDYFVFVVTNQSGVGRGYYTEQDVHIIHTYMQDELKHHDAHIDAIRYCPHHRDAIHAEYKIECNCRKPKPGMIKDILSSWPVEISKSVLVGDKPTDLEAAKRGGIRGLLYEGGDLSVLLKNNGYL
jgi:D-glycero-D-manno-heptose 1,7-bisphosphate phosphatase